MVAFFSLIIFTYIVGALIGYGVGYSQGFNQKVKEWKRTHPGLD